MVSIGLRLERGNIQGNKLRNEIGPRPIKQKANLGASYNLWGERILALAEYCFNAQAERPDQFATPNGVRLHRRRQNLDVGRAKKTHIFRECDFAIEPMRPSLSREAINRLMNL